jgi:hypothetical protein
MSGEGARTEALPGGYAFVVNVSKLVDAPQFSRYQAQRAVCTTCGRTSNHCQRSGSTAAVGRTRVPNPLGRGLRDCAGTKTMRLMKKSYKMLPKTNTKPLQLVRHR